MRSVILWTVCCPRHDKGAFIPIIGFSNTTWPAGRRAVAAVRETNGRFTDFHRFMRRAGIAPIRILSLRDAAYCQEQDIDCLSPEGLRGRLMTDPAYRRFLDSDRIYAGHQTPDTLRTTRAIDIGAGMLLYDLRHPIGREAYKSFMQHCADHFFEQELNGLDKISLYDIHCFFDPETYLSKLGALNFNPVYFGRNFRLDNLNGKMLFDRTMRYEGIFLKEYDMRPLVRVVRRIHRRRTYQSPRAFCQHGHRFSRPDRSARISPAAPVTRSAHLQSLAGAFPRHRGTDRQLR